MLTACESQVVVPDLQVVDELSDVPLPFCELHTLLESREFQMRST